MEKSTHEARWLLVPVFTLGFAVGLFGFLVA